jgi:hypothetical protein
MREGLPIAKAGHFITHRRRSLTLAAASAIVAIWLLSPHSARNVSVSAWRNTDSQEFPLYSPAVDNPPDDVLTPPLENPADPAPPPPPRRFLATLLLSPPFSIAPPPHRRP